MTEDVKRHVVVVDCESSGLDPAHHVCVEVAWWNLTTGQRGCFVPQHPVRAVLMDADLAALRVNRYIDRLADAEQDIDGVKANRLGQVLHGATIAGSNPSFDAAFLTRMFLDYESRDQLAGFPQWHHRLWDLSAYTAGVLGLDHLPGLVEVCELVGTTARPDHTAAGDVSAAGECFLRLFERTGVQP